jgi:hypothetical protein
MGATPPPQRLLPTKRLLPRWPLRGLRFHLDPRALLGLGLCGLAWGVAMAPLRQPLEGALRVSALSFVLQGNEGEPNGQLQGFLALPLRSLSIKGQGDGAAGPSLELPLSGQSLALTGGSALILSAAAPDTLGMRIALPPGTRIKNLQLEGKDQLVLDLLPPRQGARGQGAPPGAAAELTITPPIAEASPGRASAGGLQAVFQQPGSAAKRITPPQAEFRLPLAGPTRLRLQRADPKSQTVFESNLPVGDVQFISEGSSLFDQSPITLSTLRAGTLHLGRQQPLSLRPDQFLRLDPPGIGVITSLRADQGQLAVEVVGETARISSGLSLEHPTTVLQGTLLSRQLSPDQISGFFGFLAGVISSLVLTLFKGE